MHTRLDRCLLEMFIGRPFILIHRQDQDGGQNVQREHSNIHGGPTAPLDPVGSQNDDQEGLVEDCIVAAEEAIDMCYTMQTGELGLTRSSYIEYSSCRAALLALIAYSICYRTNRFSARLQRGLDAIREMALTGDSARSELSLLETLEAALHHLHVFDHSPKSTGPTAERNGIRDDYEGFVTWYKNRVASTDSRAEPALLNNGSTSGILPQPAYFDATDNSAFGTEDIRNEGSSANDWFGSDFFQPGNDAAFFNTDSSQHDTLEKDLLDSLLWIPD